MFLREGKKSTKREGATYSDVAGDEPLKTSSIPAVAFPHMTPFQCKALASPLYRAEDAEDVALNLQYHEHERRGDAVLGKRFCVVAIPGGDEPTQPGERRVYGGVYTFWWRAVFYYRKADDNKFLSRSSWNRQIVKIADAAILKLLEGVGEPSSDVTGDAHVTRWRGRRLADAETDWLLQYAERMSPKRSR